MTGRAVRSQTVLNGTLITKQSYIAREINNYLASVQSSQPCTVTTETLPFDRNCCNPLFIAPTTVDYIKLIVNQLKNKISTGNDNYITIDNK